MTATNELRRMLDERGVEHTDAEDGHAQHTWWSDGDHEIGASSSGERLAVYNLTPQQAIEATLGPQVQPPSMPEQPPYDVLIDLLRDEWDLEVMWDGLRRFWYVGLTDEGVRKRDEREATLGRGTCHRALDFDGTRYVCSACGENFGPSRWHFCPNCGRRCVG